MAGRVLAAAAAILGNASVPVFLPTPPLASMVVIPYESPACVSARLRALAFEKDVQECIRESPLLIGDLVIPIPPTKYRHLLQQNRTT